MDSKPLVSVLMPTCNVGEHLYKSIESIRKQTYENWELCIVDSGSQDLTLEMAKACADEDDRIRIKTIQGFDTINKCVKMSRGIILIRQNPMDLSLSTRLEKQIKYPQENGKDIVTCQYNRFKGSLRIPHLFYLA